MSATHLIRDIATLMFEGCTSRECNIWLGFYRSDLPRHIREHIVTTAHVAVGLFSEAHGVPCGPHNGPFKID